MLVTRCRKSVFWSLTGIALCTSLYHLDVTTYARRSFEKCEQADSKPQLSAVDYQQIWKLRSPYLPPFDEATGKFELSDKPIWIDVGSNVAAEHIEGVYTLAFEPLPQFWDTLRSQSPDVFPFPFGISTQDATVEFGISQNGHSSTMLNLNSRGVEDLKSEEWDWTSEVSLKRFIKVFTIRLESIFERLPNPELIDYLKIDAQGHDLEVLKSAGKYLRFVRRVKLEAKAPGVRGFYAGQPEPSEIIFFMKQNGFRHTGTRQACCLEKMLEVDMQFDNENSLPTLNAEHFPPP